MPECAICADEFVEPFGNNPQPLFPPHLRVCKECDDTIILPYRIALMKRYERARAASPENNRRRKKKE